ncbi:MAG: DUF6443 domain-containing protein, partial [Fulvivirga sp.]
MKLTGSLLTLIFILVFSAYGQLETTYEQYLKDFRRNEELFVSKLLADNPYISKSEIKNRVKSYYQSNFNPPDPEPNNTFRQLTTQSSTAFNVVPDDIEYLALRAIFESTGGQDWFDKSNWDYPNWRNPSTVTYQDFEDWFGVQVQNGDVTQLRLSYNNLIGSLPTELGDLDQLSYLRLYNNQLAGSIPSDFWGLSNIKWLYLGSNQFTGPIPESIGNLTLLEEFYIGNNGFSNPLPSNLWTLTNLKKLDISLNAFDGIFPAEFGSLLSLENFRSYDNGFTGPFPNITNLTNLTELSIDYNDFTGTIPSTISNLTNLGTLNIQFNQFSGQIPVGLWSISTLGTFNARFNNLTGPIPNTIGGLSRLNLLNLQANPIGGTIPESIGNLNFLQSLNLADCQLTGVIPETIGGMDILYYIYLNNNQLTGTIPESIGNLSALRYGLALSNNNLTGSIPASIGNLTLLEDIRLNQNQLEGILPASLANLGALDYFDIAQNDISGTIPFDLSSNPSLATLNVYYNFFDMGDLEGVFTSSGPVFPTTNYAVQKTVLEAPQDLTFIVGQDIAIAFIADGANNIYQWQKWDGNKFQDILGATNASYLSTNAALDDAGIYRCKVTNSWVVNLQLFSNEISIQVVEGLPPSPTVTDTNICSDQTATLTANGSGIINWYAEATGGTSFHTGTSYTTPVLSETTTYYVSQTIDGIESERVSITAFVGPIFNAAQDQSICRGDAVPIFVEGENLTVDWGENFGNQTSFVARPEVTTTYNYTVNDAFGCSTAGSILITVYESLEANILAPEPTCLGETVTLEAEEVAGASYTWEPGGLTGRVVDITQSEVMEYTLTVTNAEGCSAEASVIPEIKTLIVASEDREICVTETATLIAEGGDTYLWSTGETTQEIVFSPSGPGVFTLTVTATKEGCSSTEDVVVTVNEYCPGAPISFLARGISTSEVELIWREPDGNHLQYIIQRLNETSGLYETVATLPLGTTSWMDEGLTAETIYYYQIYSEVAAEKSESRYARARTFTPNQNYIMETEVLAEGITDVLTVPNLDYDSRNSTWNYLNGLGSDMQTVIEGASPTQKDVIQPIIYDEFGMRTKQYLSYTISQPTKPGNFRDDADVETTDFYAKPPVGVVSTAYPYAETVFDSSPQNKVLEQASPGEDWQVSTGRTVKINTTTNGPTDFLDWHVVGNDLVASSYYPAAQAKKSITTNEDNETVIMYKDMLGRELMQSVLMQTGTITTYFVYNNRGSLLYRITPKLIENLSGGLPYTIDQNTILNECYGYKYDQQERLIEEKWPDKEAVIYVYDKWDRPVLSQTGNQRMINEWSFTKYDRFNRPVLSGLYDAGSFQTQVQMQAQVDSFYDVPGASRYETFGGATLGYTNVSFPDVNNEEAYLSVTYFDNYDFIASDASFGTSYNYDNSTLGCENVAQGTYCFPSDALKILKGKVTGSKTRVLNKSEWLNEVVYYDDKGRTIQAVAQNYRGGIDRASSLYSFSGWLLATASSLVAPDGRTYGIKRRFVYDHTGRLKEGYHELFKDGVGQGEVFLAQNIYNELGQLIEKNLQVDQSIPLQSVDYRYNIRGWLESVNNA